MTKAARRAPLEELHLAHKGRVSVPDAPRFLQCAVLRARQMLQLLDEVVARVYEHLARLLKNPWRPDLEEDNTGIFSLQAVLGTNVGLVWTMNERDRQIAYVGVVPTRNR